MKYKSALLISSIFVLVTNASDVIPKVDNEFAYIQPIAVEEGTITKSIEKAPLDSDSDGVQDANDKCPNTKTGETVDINGCLINSDSDKDGVPDTVESDSDKDGVPDADDECPTTTAETKVDYRGCELDSDDDGISDSKDECPDTSKEFVVNDQGCPQTATLKVNFKPNKYNVSEDLINDLKDFAIFLKENSGYQVIIYGYTDSIGNVETNKILSQNRAQAVKRALSSYGIKTTRMTAIGKGESDPIADNMYKDGRAQNRRIEVELLQ